MGKLPKEYQVKVIENASRERYGYEGLNSYMMAATGGLPSVAGQAAAELIDYNVNKATKGNKQS